MAVRSGKIRALGEALTTFTTSWTIGTRAPNMCFDGMLTMFVSYDSCLDSFTVGQATRIREQMLYYRNVTV